MIEFIMSSFVKKYSDGKLRLQWRDAIGITNKIIKDILKDEDPDLLISIDGFDFIDSDGLVWVLLLGDYLKSRGKQIWLELPSNKYQLRYLKDSRFIDVSQDFFTISNIYQLDLENDISRKKYKSDYLRFWKVDISTVSQILNLSITKTLLDFLNIDPITDIAYEFLQPFSNLIIETNRNLVQHSRLISGEGWGYFSLSSKQFRGQPRIACTLGDAGVGFKKSLAGKGMNIKNDKDAIKGALLFRYHNQEGAGLFRAVRLASRLKGVVKIRSGISSAFLNLQKSYLQNDEQVYNHIFNEIQFRNEKLYFPGVQFYVEVEGEQHAGK